MTTEQSSKTRQFLAQMSEEQFNIGQGDGWLAGSTNSVHNPFRNNPDYDRGYEVGYVAGKKGHTYEELLKKGWVSA